MNDFGQAGRFQVKQFAQAHFEWLDALSAPRPGEPDRRCDTIAEVVHDEGLTHPRAVVIELFTQPDAEALDRTGEYLWRFRRELRHGPHDQDKYPVVGALIFLTGRCAEREVVADPPDEAGVVNVLRPRILEVAEQDAVAFLDAVEQNQLSAALLAWVPLMKGGQAAEAAKRWLGLAARLSEEDRRYVASVAWTFAEKTASRSVWKPVLETINMDESIVFREIRTKARQQASLETQRDNLTRVFQTKLSGDALTKAVAKAEQHEDLGTLSRWFDLALTLPPHRAGRGGLDRPSLGRCASVGLEDSAHPTGSARRRKG